jgi:hypothetical protein
VCICRDCSGIGLRRATDVLRKNFRGCDCRFKETVNDRIHKYGLPLIRGTMKYRQPIRVTLMRQEWRSIVARCHDPNHRDYSHYGGRGIFVCERWRTSFAAFLNDKGLKPLGLTLDRIDNNGPYSPENCKWTTGERQTRNRSNTIFVDYQGKRPTLAELAEHLAVSYAQAYRRHRAGNCGDQLAAWVQTKRAVTARG